jgi:hypothetical protein
MSSVGKKIEILSNIVVIIVALLLGAVLIKKYFLPPQPSTGNNSQSVATSSDVIGRKISLPDVNWSEREGTMILAVQSKCRFCTDSAAFYKRLVDKQLGQSKLQLIAISPEPLPTTRAYFDSLGVSVEKVSRADFRSIGLLGTPTILRVNSSGVITNVWVGQLNSKQEAEVLETLQ